MTTWCTVFALVFTVVTQSHSLIPRCHANFNLETIPNDHKYFMTARNRTCPPVLNTTCTKNITVSYYEMEPFTNGLEFYAVNVTKGVIQRILGMAFAECCGNCLRIKFNNVQNRSQLISIKTKEKSDVLFPVFTQGYAYQFNSTLPALTIPLLQLSAAMFITRTTFSAKIFAEEVVTSIVDIWPLFAVALLLAFASGVVIWIIDTWWNKEHFPRRFMTGAFEGFWWAFVSMTTVGYGDRVPKSVPGRLFACLWILCGMTICALLTAALTTAIAEVAKKQLPSIHHGKVGVLRDRAFEQSILMRGNAEKMPMNSLDEMVTALKQRTVSGIILDSYTAKTLKKNILKDNKLYVDSIIQDTEQSYLGVTIYNIDLHNAIQEYVEFHKDQIKEFVYESFKSLNDDHSDEVVMANLIFTTNSGMFEPLIYTCLVILVASLLIGGLYEIYQRNKTTNTQKVNSRANFKLTVKSLLREEEAIARQLEDLLHQWDKQLLVKMKNYHIEGMFSKSNNTFANVVVNIIPHTKKIKASDHVVTVVDDDVVDNAAPKKVKKKKKSKLKKKNRIEIIRVNGDDEGDTDDDSSSSYTKLKESKDEMSDDQDDQDENIASQKFPKKKKKTTVVKKNKKKSTKKKVARAVDENEDQEPSDEGDTTRLPRKKGTRVAIRDPTNGDVNNGSIPLRVRKLPPLNKVEQIV